MSLLNKLRAWHEAGGFSGAAEPAPLVPRPRIVVIEPPSGRMSLEDAQSEILGIQQQAIIARLGRQGVRAGGTLQCALDTLAETQAWDVSPERWGVWSGAAQKAKADAVADIAAYVAVLRCAP